MRPRRGERGSAVMEFVLVVPLLVFLLFAVVQVGLYFYARNMAAAAAADGARYAASSGVEPSAGADRASELLHAALHGALPMHCAGTADVDATTGLQTATVRCSGELRLVFVPLGLPLHVDVRSSVLRERAP